MTIKVTPTNKGNAVEIYTKAEVDKITKNLEAQIAKITPSPAPGPTPPGPSPVPPPPPSPSPGPYNSNLLTNPDDLQNWSSWAADGVLPRIDIDGRIFWNGRVQNVHQKPVGGLRPNTTYTASVEGHPDEVDDVPVRLSVWVGGAVPIESPDLLLNTDKRETWTFTTPATVHAESNFSVVNRSGKAGMSLPRKVKLEAGGAATEYRDNITPPAPYIPPPVEPSPVGTEPLYAASPFRSLAKNWDFGNTVRDVNDLFDEFATTYIYDQERLDFINHAWTRMRQRDNHVIENGVLKLIAKVEDGFRPGGLSSGMLRSYFTMEFGYFECRVKVPPSNGARHHQGFWLNPQNLIWPPEVDFMETLDGQNGENDTKSFHNLHGTMAVGPRVMSALDSDQWNMKYHSPLSQKFTVFGGVVLPDRVIHCIDGVPVSERIFKPLHNDGRPSGVWHLLYDHVGGGDWPGNPLTPAASPCVTEIDYIRVYQ